MVKKEWKHERDNVPPIKDDRVEAVLELLKKQAPLTVKQERFCNKACVERFLRARGDNLKKAVKQLRACLSWRDGMNIDQMIADEFSAELAEGFLYVAGHDDEFRPVLIFRMKQQDHQKFARLLVFTLEVAMGTMKRNMHQFVLLFDASFFGSVPAFMNLFMSTLKIVADYYPGRLFQAFVIDPPSLFPYIWKGVRPFVELSAVTKVLSSSSFRDTAPDQPNKFSDDHGASSFRFNPSPILSTSKIGSSSSSRFSFTVTNHFDSLKPWYLTFRNGSSSSPAGPALFSPTTARSLSFASPPARALPPATNSRVFPSTPLPESVSAGVTHRKPLTPQPSFFRSPASFFLNGGHIGNNSKSQQLFFPHVKLYRKPYNEISYRSMMKAPLGGLAPVLSPNLKRRHISASQRF